jgi:hypothetical protein
LLNEWKQSARAPTVTREGARAPRNCGHADLLWRTALQLAVQKGAVFCLKSVSPEIDTIYSATTAKEVKSSRRFSTDTKNGHVLGWFGKKSRPREKKMTLFFVFLRFSWDFSVANRCKSEFTIDIAPSKKIIPKNLP